MGRAAPEASTLVGGTSNPEGVFFEDAEQVMQTDLSALAIDDSRPRIFSCLTVIKPSPLARSWLYLRTKRGRSAFRFLALGVSCGYVAGQGDCICALFGTAWQVSFQL